MSALAALQLLLLAGLLFTSLAGLLVSAAVPLVLSRTEHWEPLRRHRALFLLSTSPVLIAQASVLAVIAPSLLSLLWPELDHCLAHGDHHVHLCWFHLPAQVGRWWSWLPLLAGLCWLVCQSVSSALALYRASRCIAGLKAFDAGELEPGARLLALELPLCVLAGLFRPTILLSRGLLAQLSPQQLAVVLHHERAHAARHDILRSLAARAGASFLYPAARARLLQALELASEQCCDEQAALRMRDRVCVAETIVRVERALQRAVTTAVPLTASFGGPTVVARVTALLDGPKPPGSIILVALPLTLLLLTVLASSASLHHLTESLLGLILH
ncbi:MAG: M56 family metallopeptidase [Polyangiaceae bacterium]